MFAGRNWISRSDRSCPTVKPATWSQASVARTCRARRPITTASSTSQSTCSVEIGMSSYGPASDACSLVKISGCSGSAKPDSAACDA